MVASTSEHKKEDSNVFKDAWHSVAEALHLRSEDTPPPVPPKDEKWKVKTINKAVPEEQKPDPSFWDRLFHSHEKKKADDGNDSDDDDGVSISVPADAALKQLGVEGNDQHLQEKNYFERMAQRVKEKFDADDDDDDDDSDDNDSDGDEEAKKGKTAEQLAEEKKRRRKLAPKVDPKEMQQAHKVLYKNKNADDSDSDEEEDKKMFGHWWGCRPRRSKADKQAAKESKNGKLLDDEEWEKVKKPRSKEDKVESAKEENGDGRSWWQFGSGKTREERAKERAQKEKKETAKRRQGLAAAAAYEAVKEYEARRAKKTGKPSSHSEMKAVLAGMAMAEAVKLLEKYNDDDELDSDDKDETVAEAGNKALKLFELCR
ncbi:hypothetical protein BGZ73_005736 [Actinomortierella ambigua]|nr:hypothetical protein BGZ73_005736 [Actinomortierella ambigua]